MNLTFRQALKADKKEIKRFYKQQHYSAKFMGLDQCYIVEDNNHIIASVIISQLTENNQQYFLHALVVNTCYQKQGLATKLLKYSTNHNAITEKPDSIVCFCSVDIISLYQKSGFKVLSQKALNHTLFSRYLLYRKKQHNLTITAILYD